MNQSLIYCKYSYGDGTSLSQIKQQTEQQNMVIQNKNQKQKQIQKQKQKKTI